MSSKRERLTIDINPDTVALLEKAREKGVIIPHKRGRHGSNEFFRAAVALALKSALSSQEESPEKREIQTPSFLEAPQSLPDFLSAARGEIMILGTTLTSLHEREVVETLERKIAEKRVAMSFVLLDPEALTAYDSLDQRRAKEELDQTYALLFRLQDLGIREGTVVNITRAIKIPSIGIVITDPFTDAMRARVDLFSDPHYQTKPHPFFQVDGTTMAGQDMCLRFLAYCVSFLPGKRAVEFKAPFANSSKH